MKLTVKGLNALKPGLWLTDDGERSKGKLRAKGVTGGVRFYFRYRDIAGCYDDLPLSFYDESGLGGWTLAEARSKIDALNVRYVSGDKNLRAVLEAEKVAATRKLIEADDAYASKAQAETEKLRLNLGLLMAAYVTHLKDSDKPSWKEVAKSIDRNITKLWPQIAALPADQVTPDDLMPVFTRLSHAKKYREGEKLRIYLRAAYSTAKKSRHDAGFHAFAEFKITNNNLAELSFTRPPMTAKSAQAENELKWSLSSDQSRAYWQRIKAMEGPSGALLRFHLLTGGQRVIQLGRLIAADHDGDRKSITLWDSKGRRKSPRKHVVPLIPDAVAAMDVMRGDKGSYLFTITEGFSAAGYHNVWEALQPVVDAMIEAKEIDRKFSPGIIRKTVESLLQEAGVSRELRGYLLSHGLGGVQAQHYEAYAFDKEKRAALMTLRKMLEPKVKATTSKQKAAK